MKNIRACATSAPLQKLICVDSHHSFKKVAASEMQAKIRRAENEARTRLAPGAHTEDESGLIGEDVLPRYVTLFGEYFDWKENSSRSANNTRA